MYVHFSGNSASLLYLEYMASVVYLGGDFLFVKTLSEVRILFNKGGRPVDKLNKAAWSFFLFHMGGYNALAGPIIYCEWLSPGTFFDLCLERIGGCFDFWATWGVGSIAGRP